MSESTAEVVKPAIKPLTPPPRDGGEKVPLVAAPEPAKANEPKPPDPKVLQEQFGKLTLREKALLAERQKLQQERQEFATQQAKDKVDREETARVKALIEKAKTDPEGFLKPVYGDDWYDKLTEFRLDKRPPPDMRVDEVREEVKQLKEELARREEERIANEQRMVIEQFNERARSHITAAGDKYELTNTLNYHDHVPELINLHWQKQVADGVPENERKMLSVDEAAAMVDEWLEGSVLKAAQTKRMLPKIKSLIAELDKKAAGVQTPPVRKPEGVMREVRTLSNDLTGSAMPPAAAKSEKEEEQRAIAAFHAARAAKAK